MATRPRPNISIRLSDDSFIIPPGSLFATQTVAGCWAPDVSVLATATEIQNGFMRIESQGDWFSRVKNLVEYATGVTEGNSNRFNIIMSGISGSNGVTTGGAIGLLNGAYGTTYTINIVDGVTQGLTLEFNATNKFRPYWWAIQNVLTYGAPVVVGFSGTGFTGGLGENPLGTLTSPLTTATDFASTEFGYNVVFQPFHTDAAGTTSGPGWSGETYIQPVDRSNVLDIVAAMELSESPVIGIINAGLTGNLGSSTNIDVPSGADEYIITTAGFKNHLNSTANTTTSSLISTPLCTDLAGIICRNDINNYPWTSPAGPQKGQVLNSVSLSRKLTTAQQDMLYGLKINPFVTVKGSGSFLFGDITNAADTSSLIGINVIRTIIYIKSQLLPLANAVLFETNTPETRSLFVLQAEGLLSRIQSQGGLTEYSVVCDETNNSQQVVDSKTFVADVRVKIPGSINYITINLTNT